MKIDGYEARVEEKKKKENLHFIRIYIYMQ